MQGKTQTDETKYKISKAKKGKNAGKDSPLYGIPKTKETKEKLSKSRQGKFTSWDNGFSKVVLNIQSGVFHGSAAEAADVYGLVYNNLKSYLNQTNGRKNPTNLIYV